MNLYRNSIYKCTEFTQKFCKEVDIKTLDHSSNVLELAQIPKQNPYFEIVRYFKRKNNEASIS